jgi:NAD(P)-dependent dehydrogenase (short-subunit alcohol dehydrogenase family)
VTPVQPGWTAADIPSQAGRVAIVTGTGGLGFETALALAKAGAETVLAGRSAAKGADAIARIKARVPGATIAFAQLDLADLASVSNFAEAFAIRHDRLDILINNAGVMALPNRQTTKDGFETQLGTNFLGAFALTAHLLPLLRRSPAPRTVQLSSLAHRRGFIDFDDLQGERRYAPWKAYCQSKLAMLIFALELQRRSDRHGWGLTSLAAHPGWAATELIANGPAADAGLMAKITRIVGYLSPLVSQSAAAGALPTLYAATAAAVDKSGYYGPNGFREIRGAPSQAKITGQANDPAIAARLWQVAEGLTGLRFDSLAEPVLSADSGRSRA